MTTENKQETPIELNNIKQALNKITDTELALDILTNLESLSNFVNKQNDALSDSKSEVQRIQNINQALMLRATATNTGVQTAISLPSSTSVDYDKIDSVQSIIDRI